MFRHPDQLMTLHTIHLAELQAEGNEWRLATAIMKAQQPASPHQLNKLATLRNRVSQFFHKRAQPTWQAAVKPG